MYHSLYFTTENNTNWVDYNPLDPSATVFNTFDSWHLIPTERPVIALPPVKTNFRETEFSSGSIDNTDTSIGVPIFGDRTGSISFTLVEPDNFSDTILKLAGYLHGKRLTMWLEDDPEYYYVGRWAINSIGSSEKFSTIQLDYTLYPFKLSKLQTTDGDADWFWDTLNFDNGSILKSQYEFTFDVTSATDYTSIKTWSGNTNFGDTNRSLSQGQVCPFITWTPETSGTLPIRFTNNELGLDVTTTLNSGTNRRANIIFSNLTRTNFVNISAKGNAGTLSFTMRRLMF